MNRAAFTRAACLTAAGALLLAAPAGAQQNPASKPVDPEAASIPLRTALYHDPTLAPPLDRLLQLYRDAGRAKELVDSYRQHVAQYPADAGALIVLIRLLSATNDAEAGRLTRAAATRFPEHPFLQFLLFTELQKTHESGALDALDRAIARETLPTRKRAWIDQLVPLAISSNRPELAQQHLEKLAAESTNAEGKLETARKMIAHKLYAPALTALTAAAAQKPSAEIGVDLDLAAAGAELGLGRNAAAASRLDALLARLAADYWRRNEILHRRTALVKSDADREAMLGAARSRLKAAPNDAAAALELAQLLAAFEFRREALDVLQATLARIPASEKIEKAVLELFDLLRDERGREAFLEQRLRAAPERQDLALARARSLLLLGRRSEALTVFDAFAAKLEAPARLIQILELARFLRRSAMPADAAAFFERAVALAPERLEVRRELAETWLAAGQKQKAREVFSKPLPEETETENLLEVVQFFLKQEMFEEARAALAQRRAKDPQNFDLRLADITVATRLAEREQGEKLILETRTLADTEARYRRWLESAVAFHDAFDLTAEFFRTEQERVLAAGGGWIGEAAPRRLIFAEVAANHGQKSGVASMLQGALEEDLPAELRIELRRRQLALIENDAAQAAAAERQLTALEKEDSARADEYRIRLALLAMRSQRMDRVQQILGPNAESIDVSKISDATLLSGLENLLRQQGGGTALIRILEQLTVVQPANTGVWERWISTLAISGDEERLRVSLRRLREGVDRLPLTEETRAILREQLLGSYWRSLAKLIQEDADDSQLSTALPMIELAGRLAEKREESLWLTWTRGYVLNRLGRREARDEALRELERLAMLPVSSAPAGTEPDSPVPPETPGMIAFPDGLVIGIGPARELLTGSAPLREMPPAVPISGPRGTLKARWALETDGRAPVSRIVPIDSKRLLIGDDNGKLYALDSLSGKLLWSREGPRPITSDPNNSGMQASSHAVPVVDEGRVFLPAIGGIECWSADDGRLLWRASTAGSGSGATPMYPTLFSQPGRLLVCQPASARLSALDSANGKLIWEREYPRQTTLSPLHAMNCGASLSEGRLLIYGAATAIVNAANGDVLWSFELARAKTFPVSLSATPALPPPSAAPLWRGLSSRVYGRGAFGSGAFLAFDHQMRLANSGYASGIQPGQQYALTNPAGSWAAGLNEDMNSRFGVLHGQRLLLLSNMSARTLRLDLPLSSRLPSAGGTFAGVTGKYACVISQNAVGLLDLDSGLMQSVPLEVPPTSAEEIGPSGMRPQGMNLRAALAGSVLYVSSSEGISGFHVQSRQRVFHSPWPANVAPAAPGPRSAANLSSSYLPQGRFLYDQHGQSRTLQTFAALVADGVFYTEAEPGRLVALAGSGDPKP